MSTGYRDAVYHEISWYCHLCRTFGRINYGANYDQKNRKELDHEIRVGHEKIIDDHGRIRPNCPAFGTIHFDIDVALYPAGYYSM